MAKKAADEPELPEERDVPPIDFTTFVLSLSATVLVHLGEQVPGVEGVSENLQLARQNIDLLALLEDKTRGNLTGEEERLRRVTEDLACPCQHAEARVIFVRVADRAIRLARLARAGARPGAKPPPGRSTVSEREFIDQSAHLVGKSGHPLRVAEPHFDERAVPDCAEARHRPSAIPSARMRALQDSARLLNEAEMNERDGAQPEQRDLRIDQKLAGGDLQSLRQGEPALEPCASGPRATLELVDVAVDGARGRQKRRILRRRCERFRPIGHRERLGIFRAHA